MSFTHEQIWGGVEAVALSKGITVSRLAVISGLDPTSFNRSKRVDTQGRKRWPSTETISKILQATNTDLETFTSLVLKTPKEGSHA